MLTEKEFSQEIYDHEFVFSPEGNGIDCGRTWASIQLGSIPVVKKSIITEYVKDKMPIFVYETLDDVTEEKLRNFIPETTNCDLINIDYYKNLISSLKMELS